MIKNSKLKQVYLLIEEYENYDVNSLKIASSQLPSRIICYGKVSLEKMKDIMLNGEFPSTSSVTVKRFPTRETYRRHIREMRHRGCTIKHIKSV